MKINLSKASGPVDRIKIGLGIALLTVLMGCVGYVDGGYAAARWWCRGLICIFSAAAYDRGRDVHAFSQRGFCQPCCGAPWRRRRQGEGGEPHNSLDGNRI